MLLSLKVKFLQRIIHLFSVTVLKITMDYEFSHLSKELAFVLLRLNKLNLKK